MNKEYNRDVAIKAIKSLHKRIEKKEKKQTRKIGVAGGFINQMMGNNSTTPKVGHKICWLGLW